MSSFQLDVAFVLALRGNVAGPSVQHATMLVTGLE
jgi:hypothetical protein